MYLKYFFALTFIIVGSAAEAVDNYYLQNGRSRLVQIKIVNHSTKTLYGGRSYLNLGMSEYPPSTTVMPGARTHAVFQKTSFSVQGTEGVLTYRIGEEINSKAGRFAIYWSVPIEYIWHKNWFGIKWIGENERASKELFEATINGSFPFADENRQASIINSDYVVLAKMSNNEKSLLEVKVYNRSDCTTTNDDTVCNKTERSVIYY